MIKIQAVLFETSPAALQRFLTAVVAAARASERPAMLHLGDCSAQPLLSADELAEQCQAADSGYRLETSYTYFGQNLGFGQGHNRLWFDAPRAERLLVLNPDALPALHLLARLNRTADERADFGAIEARQLPIEHPKGFDVATWETDWVSGACFLLDGAAFSAEGGFDDRFFMYAEDVDLSWRLRAAGKRLYSCPETFVMHAKRLVHRQPAVSETERYHGPLGLMLLRAKYGHEALNDRTVTLLRRHPGPENSKMLSDYERLRDQRPRATSRQIEMAHFAPNGDLTGFRWTYPLPDRMVTAP